MNIMLRLGGTGALDERASNLEHHGDPRGVVVGARVEHAAAHAQMIEMGGHDHPLVAQLRVRSAQQGTDVSPLDGPGLLAGDRLDISAVKQRGELETAKLLDQVGNGLLAPCSAPAAEFGRCEQLRPRLRRRACSGRGGFDAWPATGDRCVRANTNSANPNARLRSVVRYTDVRRIVAGVATVALPRIRASVITRPSTSRKNREFAARSPIVWHISHGLGKGSLHGGVFCLASHGSKCRP